MRKMKDSGITWIKEIPETWNVQRGKNILTLMKRSPEGYDEVITCFRDGEVTLRSNRREDGFTFSDKEIGYQGIEKGDLVIHGMDGFAGAIGISDSCGKGSPVLVVCTTKNNSKFLMYYLRMLATQNVFVAMATGIRERSCDLRWNKIADLLFPIPTINEQKQIADYLEEKCSKIDAIIARQEEIIEKLKEYKLSIITESVTKGLNPNVEMKNSRNEKIGYIPSTWDMIKMSMVCSVITDYVASGSFADLADNVEYLDDPDYAMLIRTTDLSGKGHKSKPVYINQHSYDFLSNSNLFGGEVILPNIGASVGDVYIVPKLYERMSLAPNSIMVKTNYVDRYYYYYFCSDCGKKSLLEMAQSAAQPKFNKTELRQLRVPVPPISEQKEIVSKLDMVVGGIDTRIGKAVRLQSKLQEYKKSLIYEVVTGKKEV